MPSIIGDLTATTLQKFISNMDKLTEISVRNLNFLKNVVHCPHYFGR